MFTYCIRIDDGAAPNPYWGKCTLVICKPRIRSTAAVGDWIVGMGSKNSPIGDCREKVVYAMRVSQKMTMREYDFFTLEKLPQKIPDWQNAEVKRRLGDSIYDFSTNPPSLRKSVHKEENQETDLGGKFALISDHFFYFGISPVLLPENLKPIVKTGQAHRSRSNAPYVEKFIKWIHSLGYRPNSILAEPQIKKSNSCVNKTC